VLQTRGPHDAVRVEVLTDSQGRPALRQVALRQSVGRGDDRAAGGGGLRAAVKVTCEPQISTASDTERFRPNADGTAFVKYEEVPSTRYPELRSKPARPNE